MFKFRSLRSSIRVEAVFVRPILEWTHVPGRFFSMVYDALAGKIVVNPNDFSVSPSSVLGETRVKYSIYGGVTSVSLHADKLLFEFPNLVMADYPVVQDIVASVHDAFPKAFPELNYNRIDVQSAEHLDLLEDEAVTRFLDRYKVSGVERSFNSPVVLEPGVKFAVVAEDQNWQCSFVAERSQLSATGLFILLTMSVRNTTAASPYLDKAGAFSTLVNSCLAVVGLESADASVS